ncbi:Site-specific recombinase XerD [Onishia taeanensis]|uniref:Site-specific recombinase XerD n=1 Tax=Onishia taeanensis TaxID=284577 RepID=A0A1G7NCU4_9GAMM|nr:tyrosine-type recombinase/integrase [Halomonas taeanensis]SDF71853.1 Site-specific recombinase XerD [Halomonas taeanensis]
MKDMPKRWQYKHGAYYYLPRLHEREMFDGKTWYRLGKTYSEALRAFAEIQDLQLTEKLASLIDRYETEVLPTRGISTQNGYKVALRRLRKGLGHNPAGSISPKLMYRYMDALTKKKGMQVANTDLKVINQVMNAAVRWGVIERNPLKGTVKYFGKRDGLAKARDRYVEDWELAAWQTVATRQQRAFAAIVMLTGIRKSDCLRIMEAHVSETTLMVDVTKNKRPVVFEMTDALQAAIEEARACKPTRSLYLLPNSKGECYVNERGESKPWDKSWRRSMTRAIELSDLEEGFTRHDLRAKVGSDAEDERRAQELLDHTSPSTTRQHYRRKKRAIRPVK